MDPRTIPRSQSMASTSKRTLGSIFQSRYPRKNSNYTWKNFSNTSSEQCVKESTISRPLSFVIRWLSKPSYFKRQRSRHTQFFKYFRMYCSDTCDDHWSSRRPYKAQGACEWKKKLVWIWCPACGRQGGRYFHSLMSLQDAIMTGGSQIVSWLWNMCIFELMFLRSRLKARYLYKH